jgi:hypothetical protein
MTAFVEECRREWKRLGVPDLLADEMATDLHADLVEAEADGVSAAEILGESDPRRFAATVASERGLVGDSPPKKSRKRFWIVFAVCLFVLLVLLALAAGGLLVTTSVGNSGPAPPVFEGTPIRSITVPNLIGRRACKAERIALAAHLVVRGVRRSKCNALVVGQRPAPGSIVPLQKGSRMQVSLRLRRARR